jgi:hypothetical protein
LFATGLTGRSQGSTVSCFRAEEIVEDFSAIKSLALDPTRVLAERRLNGLVVDTDTLERLYPVIPASEIIRFVVPRYRQCDSSLASLFTESIADQAANKRPGQVIRDRLRQKRKHVRVVDPDDAIIDRSEGEIAASPLPAAALKS